MNAKVRRPYKMAASHNNNKVLATNLATLCNNKYNILASPGYWVQAAPGKPKYCICCISLYFLWFS